MAGRWWMVVVAGAALVVPACGGGGTDRSTEADASSADAGIAKDANGSASGSSGAVATEDATAPAGQPVVAVIRQVVSTAEMTVVAKDVDRAVANAERAAAERGGFVFGREDSSNGDDHATITLKVPPDNFRALLDDLGDLGKEERRKVTTDDVTAQGVDLDARIVSAQKSVDRVRGFLDETKNVGELSGVEAELTRRETELEQLVGQRRVLDAQVALATVTLTVNATPAPAPPVGDALKGVPGFGNALAAGVGALVKVGRVGGAGLGYALPFLVVVGIPVQLLRLARRRRAGGRPVGDTPDAALT